MECVKCVLQAKEMRLNEKGVCNFCQEYEKREKVRKAEMLHPGLPWIWYQLKKTEQNKKYDCLIGLSGGVDSSLCLHYLKENDIRPLAFSIDNGWNTKESDENIMRLVEGLKVPFYRYTINIERFRELQAAFMKSGTKNIEIPTDHILMASTYEMAAKYGIKYIISGGNHATEGIMPQSYGYEPKDLRFIRAIYKKFTGKNLRGLPTISLPQYLYYRFVKGIKIINLLDYTDYNREEAKKLLADKYGWKDYHRKHNESIFTHWFQECYLPQVWGLDKRRPHLSSMINSGQLTKEQALEELKKPLDGCKYTPEIMGQLGIPTDAQYIRHDYKDYPNNEWLYHLLSKIYGIIRSSKRPLSNLG